MEERKITESTMEKVRQLMKDISGSMSKKKYIDMIKANRDIVVQQIEIFGDKEVSNRVLERAKEIGKENISKLSDDEIVKIFEECQANDLLKSIADDQIDKGFLREYFSYIEESDKQLKDIDALIVECDDELKECHKKISEIVGEVGDISKFIMYSFEEESKKLEEGSKAKQNYENAINVVKDALTLRPIIELYKSIGTKGTMREFKNFSEMQRIIEKFYKVVKSYNLSVDFRAFKDFEVKFMDEKYHQYNGLFIFSIMKYFSNKGYGKRISDGLFITQLAIVLQSIYNNYKSEEDLKEFIGYASELLDLFM